MSQRAGVRLTALVMLGMLLASSLVVILGGQSAAALPIGVTFNRQLSGNPPDEESGSPYLLIVQGAPEKGSKTWWGWVVVNPTNSTITVTEVRVKDNIGKDWDWTVDVQGYPTSGWADGGSDGLYWSGSENISAHSATYFRVRANQGGVKELADHTMIWTAMTTENLERSSLVVGIDKGSWGGMFYNKPGDTTEQTEAGTYPDGLYAYLDVDENDDNLNAGTEYVFYVNVHEWAGKAIDPGGTLTITIPKEFTNVALVDNTDFTDAAVSGGGTENWTIQGTNDSAIQNNVIHLSFRATTPTGYSTASNWEFDTRFTGTGAKGETVRYICEADVLVMPPPAAWHLIETWTGAVEAPAAWQLIETWTGTVEAPAAWQLIETWTGAMEAPIAWQLIETWIGTVSASAAWRLIETWTGTIGAPAEWELIETWTGTVQAPAEWRLIETWTGTIQAPATWQIIETWIGTVQAPIEWRIVETWTGTIGAPAEWQLIETWTGTVETLAEWQLIETWTGTIQAPATWQIIETWIGTVQAPIEWQIVETWTGTIGAPAEWQPIETWTGVIEASAEWRLIEAWTGVVEAPAEWQLIETWSGAIESPVEWQLIEEWLGTVSAQAVWYLIGSWTGAVEAPVAWQLIETWTGAVEAPAAWQLIETWTETIEAPAAWQLIETWTGTIEAPAAWQLIETWTGIIGAPVYPSKPTLYLPADGSITNDNTPYFEWTLGTNADNHRLLVDNDPAFTLPEENVLLGATDNTYTPTAELADENYSWKVIAINAVGENESTVWTFVVAVKVRAVDVSVSPSWQENIAGGLLSYVVVVTNLGEVADDLNLSVSDILGWDLSLDNTRFEDVENGGSRSTTLRVTIPSTALPSQTDNITVTVKSEGDPSKSDSENCQAHVALPRDVEVEISPSWKEGSPDETLLYTVTVSNTGNLDDKYNLMASDTLGWYLEISPTELWLKAGENDIASLSVTIPLETVSSITDVITVRAEGTLAEGTPADPENVSAENTAEARCTVVRQVDVSISPNYQSGLPGSLLTYTVTVTNTGNALDTYKLTTSDNASWSRIVSPSSIDLSPGASGNSKLKVVVPSDAARCTRDNVIVVATSQENTEVSDNASCIAHAENIIFHSPIHIVGNDNFTQANGVKYGSGTPDDPYVIGYWDINASNTHGIWIENTDVYFIIRDCRVHGADDYPNYGIYFDHVTNGEIYNVTSYFNEVGIYLDRSSNNLVSNCRTSSKNIDGICLKSSSNNEIEGCTTKNNFKRGVHLYSSDNNLISNCTAESNADGICLKSSSNNDIEKCTTSNNGLYGIVLWSSENNIVSDCDSNNNNYGIYLGDLSNNNHIYHNNFVNNDTQAWDECSNCWDNSYPSGGNYWGDYTGSDEYQGENQDVPGSDGIGDTPYHVPGDNNIDRYPLVRRGVKLTISPGYNEGMPGAKLSYDVAVTNTGNLADNYSLTVSDNAGWGPTIMPSSLSVYPGRVENAILEVTIPENAENSDRDKILVIARSQTDNTVGAEDSCVAVAVIRDVTVSISPSYLSALPGVEIAYTVTVINTGLVDDTYNLSTMDTKGWGPLVSPSSLSVSVGENGTATLSVTIPENATGCTSDDITVIATSLIDNMVSDNASCIAHVTIVRSVNVSISPSQKAGLPGAILEYLVTVTNTGNVDDNYGLTVEDETGWAPTLVDNFFENVAPSEGKTTLLTITIPENENLIGTKDNITVTAISQENENVSDNATCIAYAGEEFTFNLNLVAGWNLVSFPVASESDTPDNIFAGQTYYIWKWDAVNKMYVSPPSNQPVELGVGYWIWVDHDKTVATSGIPVENYSIDLVTGWNLVGFPVTNENTTPDNLFAGQTYYIWKWDAENKRYVSPSPTAPVEIGVGYWIWLDQDKTVTVPL